MSDIDEFATSLLEEAKRFHEKAKESSDAQARVANLHASLLLAFSALEAHVNAVADDFATRRELSSHDVSVLLEREVTLDHGEFKLQNNLKMVRLEERILFIYRRFSAKLPDFSSGWWPSFKTAMSLRNQLSHPKKVPTIRPDDVRRALEAVIDTLDSLYSAVYKRRFPARNRGVESRLTF